MKLLAIDPGDNHTKRNMGWACFFHSYLVSSGEDNPDRIARFIETADAIVYEQPEVYRSRFCKGDPNNLLRLAEQIGYIKAKADSACFFHHYLPGQWKGQLPKPIVHKRAVAVLTTQDALGPRLSMHNAWDAIALGLVFLRRLRLS